MRHQLIQLRKAMKEHNIDAYLITSSDFHGSEYIGAFFKGREYVSGFTGSAGVLLVFQDWAGLWTDGRYFLQAESELAGSDITLMKQGFKETPSLHQVLKERLTKGQCFSFDGRCVTSNDGKQFERVLTALGIRMQTDCDLLTQIWKTRPALSAEPIWELHQNYAGLSRSDKIQTLRNMLKSHNADYCIVASLEEIAWLLNLRGNDIIYTPVFLSFLILSQDELQLYANPASISPSIKEALQADGITIFQYDDIYSAVSSLSSPSCIWLASSANYTLSQTLPKECKRIDRPTPIAHLKAIKNETEIENMKLVHVKDGVAQTKFMYWLKHLTLDGSETELSLASKLENFRTEQENYLGASFSPIVGFNAHGAIVHYSATEESNAQIDSNGFLLVDTGGHYLNGTTDCTRTYALGTLSQKQKSHYTAVLCGNLSLADACFPRGTTGAHLDVLARQPLWKLHLDYAHGTGHGVSYLTSVHEGPQQISCRGNRLGTAMESGMVTSNEPGVYFAGEYGIRLENLLLCTQSSQETSGDFLSFETLTLTPFDLDAISKKQMSSREIDLLNAYHQMVFEKISPYLTEEETKWLSVATRPLCFD